MNGPCACDTDPWSIEVRGIHDGTLLWRCPTCGHTWPRFDRGPLHQAALDFITRTSGGTPPITMQSNEDSE